MGSHTDTEIVGGIDTHKDSHTVAALSGTGRLLGTAQFPATPGGYQELLAWLRGFGRLVRVGVEGTGSYGAGVCDIVWWREVGAKAAIHGTGTNERGSSMRGIYRRRVRWFLFSRTPSTSTAAASVRT